MDSLTSRIRPPPSGGAAVFSVTTTTAASTTTSQTTDTTTTTTTTSTVVGRIDEGDAVSVWCQTIGPVVHSGGVSSPVWDQLRDGDWVPDVYVTTPRHGGFTPGLPSCLLPTLG